MPPLRFRPLLKRIRWGGTRLGTRLRKPIGDDTDVAESWEVCDHGDDQSVVDGGPFDGWTLARLVHERNVELLGRHAGLSQFPLLVKFLDATDRLSVQVHPDDALAKRYDPAENGKTEAWVVIDAEPGSRLFAGLRGGVDRAEFERALEEDRVAETLHSFEVHPGDAVFIPAGTVHAIGEGVLLAEVQQSSDLTFRLHDWGRVGTDGRPRELHVDEALGCIDFTRGPVDPLGPRPFDEAGRIVENLVSCEHFVLHRHRIDTVGGFEPTDRFRVLLVMQGSGVFEDDDKAFLLNVGSTILVPAATSRTAFYPEEPTILLEATLPD